MKRFILFIMILTFIFILFSCEDKSDNIPSFSDYPTMDRLIDEGYEALRDGDYQHANELFRQANERDAFDVRVYDGLGWSYLFVNNPSLAISAFGNLQAFGQTTQEKANAYMGSAASHSVMANHEDAKINARKTIELQNNYTHNVLSTINVNDIYLILARGFWANQQYDSLLIYLRENDTGAVSGSSYIEDATETIEVLADTLIDPITGMVRLPMGEGMVALLHNVQYVGITGYVYPIGIDFDRNEVLLLANPIASVGNQFEVTYGKITDFMAFKIAVNTEIENQEIEFGQ